MTPLTMLCSHLKEFIHQWILEIRLLAIIDIIVLGTKRTW